MAAPEELQTFLRGVAANARDDNFLVVKHGNYHLSFDEAQGEIVDWTLQYLRYMSCPAHLEVDLTRSVLDETRLKVREGKFSSGMVVDDVSVDCVDDSLHRSNGKTVYASMTLLQNVTSTVHEVCQKLLKEESKLSLPKPRPTALIRPTSVCAVKNGRKKMEDRHVVIHDLEAIFNENNNESNNVSFFGVYDGHAGRDAAAFAACRVHERLLASSSYPVDPVAAMKDAFATTDNVYLHKGKTESLRSGTTASCVLINDNTIYSAWLGDSQTLLVRNGQPIRINEPHKPNRKDEKRRIEDLGGSVIHWGTWRVNGQLAVSRAIGDGDYKPFISAEPDITSIRMNGSEDFLIVACDGLWDAITPEMATLIVFNQLAKDSENIQAVSQRLMEEAKAEGSSDNISIIVVFFKSFSELINAAASTTLARDEQSLTEAEKNALYEGITSTCHFISNREKDVSDDEDDSNEPNEDDNTEKKEDIFSASSGGGEIFGEKKGGNDDGLNPFAAAAIEQMDQMLASEEFKQGNVELFDELERSRQEEEEQEDFMSHQDRAWIEKDSKSQDTTDSKKADENQVTKLLVNTGLNVGMKELEDEEEHEEEQGASLEEILAKAREMPENVDADLVEDEDDSNDDSSSSSSDETADTEIENNQAPKTTDEGDEMTKEANEASATVSSSISSLHSTSDVVSVVSVDLKRDGELIATNIGEEDKQQKEEVEKERKGEEQKEEQQAEKEQKDLLLGDEPKMAEEEPKVSIQEEQDQPGQLQEEIAVEQQIQAEGEEAPKNFEQQVLHDQEQELILGAEETEDLPRDGQTATDDHKAEKEKQLDEKQHFDFQRGEEHAVEHVVQEQHFQHNAEEHTQEEQTMVTESSSNLISFESHSESATQSSSSSLVETLVETRSQHEIVTREVDEEQVQRDQEQELANVDHQQLANSIAKDPSVESVSSLEQASSSSIEAESANNVEVESMTSTTTASTEESKVADKSNDDLGDFEVVEHNEALSAEKDALQQGHVEQMLKEYDREASKSREDAEASSEDVKPEQEPNAISLQSKPVEEKQEASSKLMEEEPKKSVVTEQDKTLKAQAGTVASNLSSPEKKLKPTTKTPVKGEKDKAMPQARTTLSSKTTRTTTARPTATSRTTTTARTPTTGKPSTASRTAAARTTPTPRTATKTTARPTTTATPRPTITRTAATPASKTPTTTTTRRVPTSPIKKATTPTSGAKTAATPSSSSSSSAKSSPIKRPMSAGPKPTVTRVQPGPRPTPTSASARTTTTTRPKPSTTSTSSSTPRPMSRITPVSTRTSTLRSAPASSTVPNGTVAKKTTPTRSVAAKTTPRTSSTPTRVTTKSTPTRTTASSSRSIAARTSTVGSRSSPLSKPLVRKSSNDTKKVAEVSVAPDNGEKMANNAVNGLEEETKEETLVVIANETEL